MDMAVERKLSFLGGDWIREQAEAMDVNDAETIFWYNFDAAVWKDIATAGVLSVARRHGRRRKDVGDNVDPIFAIMNEDSSDTSSSVQSYHQVSSILNQGR